MRCREIRTPPKWVIHQGEETHRARSTAWWMNWRGVRNPPKGIPRWGDTEGEEYCVVDEVEGDQAVNPLKSICGYFIELLAFPPTNVDFHKCRHISGIRVFSSTDFRFFLGFLSPRNIFILIRMYWNAPNESFYFKIFLGVPPAKCFQFFSPQSTPVPDICLTTFSSKSHNSLVKNCVYEDENSFLYSKLKAEHSLNS